jgi:hypothetical protein
MIMDKNLVLVSAALVFKNTKGRRRWFIVKQTENGDWEIPKTMVRKAESSARTALRMMSEKGAMTVKIIDEVGRAGGITTVNGKTLPQRHLYYLLRLEFTETDPIGFPEHAWLEYAKAVRKLSSKRERTMLKQARKVCKKWKKMQATLEK